MSLLQRARRRCSVFALEKRDPRALRDADALDIEVELLAQLVEGEVSVGNVLDIQATAVAGRIGPCRYSGSNALDISDLLDAPDREAFRLLIEGSPLRMQDAGDDIEQPVTSVLGEVHGPVRQEEPPPQEDAGDIPLRSAREMGEIQTLDCCGVAHTLTCSATCQWVALILS